MNKFNKASRSKELNDLLNSKTGWSTRYGASLVLLVLLICFFFTWFIKYPDTVRITTSVKQHTDQFCEIFIPQSDIRKIKSGQQVSFKFRDFPFQKFGIVKGIVDSIYMPSVESRYKTRIKLSGGLTTSYGKKISYTDGLIAETEIIIEYERLSNRLLSSLKIKGIAENP